MERREGSSEEFIDIGNNFEAASLPLEDIDPPQRILTKGEGKAIRKGKKFTTEHFHPEWSEDGVPQGARVIDSKLQKSVMRIIRATINSFDTPPIPVPDYNLKEISRPRSFMHYQAHLLKSHYPDEKLEELRKIGLAAIMFIQDPSIYLGAFRHENESLRWGIAVEKLPDSHLALDFRQRVIANFTEAGFPLTPETRGIMRPEPKRGNLFQGQEQIIA